MAGKPLNEGREPLQWTENPRGAKHGGSGTVYNKGCKCDDCREAHRKRQKAGDEARHAKMLSGESNPEHGKVSTYRNYICRCAPCTAAHSARCAEYAAKRKAAKQKS